MPGYHKLRLPQQYRALLDLDASGFAWEWLRRNPAFRSVWASAGAAARRASAQAAIAARRTTSGVTELGEHPLASRTAPWGLSFPPHSDTPAIDRPLIGWTPELRADTLSLVRPLPWARAIAGLRYAPERWGPGVFKVRAPGGSHLLLRRHGSAELTLWLPADLAPSVGEPFGLYLHADRHHTARIRAAGRLVRRIGTGRPLHEARHPQAHRHAAMLCVYDLTLEGTRLHDVAILLLESAPDDWRASCERSDFRRLLDAGARMVAGDYRSLLRQGGKAAHCSS